MIGNGYPKISSSFQEQNLILLNFSVDFLLLHHNHQCKMSIENILKTERSKYSLPVHKLSQFLYGAQFYHQMKDLLNEAPILDYTPNIYNKSRQYLLQDSYRYLARVYNYFTDNPKWNKIHPQVKIIYGQIVNPHQFPGTAHIGMFVKYIQLMGTEEHKKEYLEKSKNYEIVGCYAQTEIGHGSDIRNLQTTATFDPKTQEWVINTPSLSGAKYWPGELSFFANYAIVFAQTITKGKNLGVYPFLVKIKDKEYNWLPGIQGGDIGPKIGQHAKENGFMLLHNFRIPKNNLLTKYVTVSTQGELTSLGDPRVGYGTMMHIRELISCAMPKNYAIPIIIGTRYSLFRKQFRNGKKEEVTILDYQTQQEKIIPRIAEYYALIIGGNKIRKVSQKNTANIQKNDFSLLQETHSNLSFSKAQYSEIVYEGMETIRRALGGHGTSFYSGVPQILNQFAAHNTHEGQNTVMYIQTARYILKSYLGFMTKGKKLTDSVKYIELFESISETKFSGKAPWTMYQLRTVLLKGIKHVLSMISLRMMNKENGETEMDIINYKVGSRLQQLAQLHGSYYTVDAFIEAIENQHIADLKPIITDLCELFCIGQIERLGEPILQAGFICPIKFASLSDLKEKNFRRLRPIIVALIDSFGIPEKYYRSELAVGNPYNNFLDRARECELNLTIQQSAKLMSKFPEVVARYNKSKL